jgi:hypothetical protein
MNTVQRVRREQREGRFVEMVLVFVRQENAERFAGAAREHLAAQVAVGRPLVPAAEEGAGVVQPGIDQQGVGLGFDQEAVVPPECEFGVHMATG